MIYGRVATGYRPGGPNLVTSLSTNQTFSADKLINYELGFKTDIAGGRGTFNTSIYHIDWSSIQLAFNVGGTNQQTNGGDASVDGLETSFTYRISGPFSILASGAYTDAKLTSPVPALGITADDDRLPLSARFSGAVAADYIFQAPLGFAGDLTLAYRYQGERNAGFAGSPLAPLYKLDSYDTLDATLSLTSQSGLVISPYIKNIFDVRGEVSASTSNNVYVASAPVPVTLSQPRTIGLTVSRKF